MVTFQSIMFKPTKTKSHQLIFNPSFLFLLEQCYYTTLWENVNISN